MLIDYIILMVAIFSVSWASILVLLSNAPGIVCAFWRMTLSSIITLFLTSIKNKEIKVVLNIPIIFSGISLAIHFSFWMESLYKIPVALSTTIVNLHPIFSTIIGSLIREKIKRIHLIGIITAIIGAAIMVKVWEISTEIEYLGIIYALIGALSFSTYLSINKISRKNMDTLTLTTGVYGIGGLTTLIYIMINKINFIIYPQSTWIYIILITMIPMLMGHTLLNYLLRNLGLVIVAVSTLGEPIGSTVLAYTILKQKIDLTQIFGMMTTLAGIFITTLSERKINQ
ncbi:MAG: DMT family transporter [Candidatus Methanomethylicia archaeon]